jgi:WD40 repeat protein
MKGGICANRLRRSSTVPLRTRAAVALLPAIAALLALAGCGGQSRTAYKQLGQALQQDGQTSFGVAFSPSGRLLVSSGDFVPDQLWDLGTHRRLATLDGFNPALFSPDGRILAYGTNNGIELLDVSTHKPLAGPFGDSGLVAMVFSPDGRTLATSDTGLTFTKGTIRFWDVRTHRQLGPPIRFRKSSDYNVSIAFSPNGRILATAGNNTVRLWDVHTHRQLGRQLRGQRDAVTSLAFSPNGRILASASDDDTVHLWDVRTHRQLGRTLGHNDDATLVPYNPNDINSNSTIPTVAFNPNGRILASSNGLDDTVRFWNVRTHRQLGAPLKPSAAHVMDLAFSPNGRILATISDDNNVRLWNIAHLGRPVKHS